MTSVRPKLKPEMPRTITAWDTATGRPVWMTASGAWTDNPDDIAAFAGDDAVARLAFAQADEGRVTDPYFMETTLAGDITGREILRETIRAIGPTVHPQFHRGVN